MKRIGLTLGASLITVGLTLSACSSGPPSKGDIADVLTDYEIPKDLADCVAEKLLDSDLSDDQLNALADDDKSGLSSDEETEVLDEVTEAAGTCATE